MNVGRAFAKIKTQDLVHCKNTTNDLQATARLPLATNGFCPQNTQMLQSARNGGLYRAQHQGVLVPHTGAGGFVQMQHMHKKRAFRPSVMQL